MIFNIQIIARIEEHLQTKLPESYVRELLNYPFADDSAPFHDDFWGDARDIIERNLMLREGFGNADWPEDFLAIGNDDVGNVYFLRAANEDRNVYCAYVDSADAGEIIDEVQAPNVADYVAQVKIIY